MATYTFRAVVEPDDDAWRAYCPDLEDKGGATWGDTRDQALHRLNEVVHLVVAEPRGGRTAARRRPGFGGYAGLRHGMSDPDWSRLRSLTAREIIAALTWGIRGGPWGVASLWPVPNRDLSCDKFDKKQDTVG